MSKKIILSIVLFCLGIVAKAAATDISECENIVYAKSTTAMAGTTIKLPILMKNTVSVPGFQFDMVLPEGVCFVKAELSLDRTTATNTNTFEYQEQADGAIRVLVASTSNATFTGNAGEVATVTLSINENVADGSYPIILKGIVISDLNAQGVQSLEEVESTLTVGKPEYSTDFGIQIPPFELSSSDVDGVTADVSLTVNNGSYKTIKYDIIFPDGWIEKELLDFENKVSGRGKTWNNEKWHPLWTNTANFSSTTNLGVYTLYPSTETGDYTIPDGIYPIQITNIVATDAKGNKYYAAPTTTYVKVGEPTEGEITLEGHVTEDVTNALANETSLKKIDMSKVVSIDGSLTLRDKYDLIAPKYDVPVSAVTYKRDVTNKWGTVCLPFDVTSSTAIQYYKLKEVGESNMTFEPVTTVTAGTPAVFRLLDENVTEADMSTTDAVLKAGDMNWTGDVAQWEMKGTYSNITIVPSTETNNIYYIATNKVLYANQQFNVAAYRGWFETPKTASSNSKVYSVGFGDDDTTGIDLIEKENGEIDMIFDISGKQLPQSKKGINIINNKKVIVK